MKHALAVRQLLTESETRTGKSTSFIVGQAGIGRTLINLWDADATLEVDLEAGLTPAKKRLILDWFEPLATA